MSIFSEEYFLFDVCDIKDPKVTRCSGKEFTLSYGSWVLQHLKYLNLNLLKCVTYVVHHVLYIKLMRTISQHLKPCLESFQHLTHQRCMGHLGKLFRHIRIRNYRRIRTIDSNLRVIFL